VRGIIFKFFIFVFSLKIVYNIAGSFTGQSTEVTVEEEAVDRGLSASPTQVATILK
jgi:hypothetical protein